VVVKFAFSCKTRIESTAAIVTTIITTHDMPSAFLMSS
jgi:hypothetical protein